LGRLRDALRRFQTSVYYLDTQLREFFEMKSHLEALESAYRDLQDALAETPDLERVVEAFIRENDILPVYKELRARYESVLALLRKYEPLVDEIDAKLERYRSYRYYLFKDDELVPRFVDLLLSDRDSVIIRPLIFGGHSIDDALKTVGAEPVGKLSYRVPGDRAADAADVFLRQFGDYGFVIEADDVKLTWKPDVNVLRVDVPRDKIHEVDEIAQRIGATILAA